MRGSGHPGSGHVAGKKGKKTRGQLTSCSLPPASLTIPPEQADPATNPPSPRPRSSLLRDHAEQAGPGVVHPESWPGDPWLARMARQTRSLSSRHPDVGPSEAYCFLSTPSAPGAESPCSHPQRPRTQTSQMCPPSPTVLSQEDFAPTLSLMFTSMPSFTITGEVSGVRSGLQAPSMHTEENTERPPLAANIPPELRKSRTHPKINPSGGAVVGTAE